MDKILGLTPQERHETQDPDSPTLCEGHGQTQANPVKPNQSQSKQKKVFKKCGRETSAPRPSPPQVCGGEGELPSASLMGRAVGRRWAAGLRGAGRAGDRRREAGRLRAVGRRRRGEGAEGIRPGSVVRRRFCPV